MRTIIVTRHPGALEWLRKHYPELFETTYQEDPAVDLEVVEPIVVAHAEPVGVAGNRVIGVLPFHLAALAAEYWHLDISVPAEARGKELTCAEMERYGARLTRYLVLDAQYIEHLKNILAGAREANPGLAGQEELEEKV